MILITDKNDTNNSVNGSVEHNNNSVKYIIETNIMVY